MAVDAQAQSMCSLHDEHRRFALREALRSGWEDQAATADARPTMLGTWKARYGTRWLGEPQLESPPPLRAARGSAAHRGRQDSPKQRAVLQAPGTGSEKTTV